MEKKRQKLHLNAGETQRGVRKVVESNKNCSYKNDVNAYKLRDKRSEVYIWESSPQTCTLTGLSYIPNCGCKISAFFIISKLFSSFCMSPNIPVITYFIP